MLDIGTIFLIIAVVVGFYVAWNIGANDVANAMGTSVGSGALKLWQAVILAAILEFAGAMLLGSHVSATIECGVIDPMQYANNPVPYVLGMLGSLLAVGVWLQIASYFGWPVSTTHTIIGAIAGFALITVGIQGVHWGTLLAIVLSWVVSPALGGSLGFIMFTQIRRHILYKREPIAAAKRVTPILVFFLFGILALVLLFQGVEHVTTRFEFWQALGLAIAIGLGSGGIAWLLVRLIPTPSTLSEEVQSEDVAISLEKALRHLRRVAAGATGAIQEQAHTMLQGTSELVHQVKTRIHFETLETQTRVVEKIFVYLQILSACFMAFAHGSNDVANAMGPLAGIIRVLHTGLITEGGPVPLWILALGGAGIVVGLATWGWRVIATVGKKITELTPTRGFAAEFSAATTVVIASRLGLPISTTHTLVGAVLGVGLARGINALNLNVLRDIVISWVVTVPAGAILSIFFYQVLRFAFT